MELKPDSRSSFTQTIESEILPLLRRQKGFKDAMIFVNPEGKDVFAVSLWDSKKDAEAYARGRYTEVAKILGKLLQGTPRVKIFEVATSTCHDVAAKQEAA
jgi:heme-degrading monooxygenase HmoA